eukprot:scaffold5788_cov95-Isochrysis_galbana.AAC.1
MGAGKSKFGVGVVGLAYFGACVERSGKGSAGGSGGCSGAGFGRFEPISGETVALAPLHASRRAKPRERVGVNCGWGFKKKRRESPGGGCEKREVGGEAGGLRRGLLTCSGTCLGIWLTRTGRSRFFRRYPK